MADYNARTLAAIAGCIAGETLVDTPNGQKPIRNLLGINPIYCLSPQGIKAVDAFIFRKGKAQLYQIKTKNGRQIEATADHLLLISNGQTVHWNLVGDLMSKLNGQKVVSVVSDVIKPFAEQPEEYSPGLQESSSVSCLSSRLSDVRHWLGRELDYQGRYSEGCRHYGLQPHQVVGNDQSPFPLSSGVPVYNQMMSGMDGRGISQEYNHLYQYAGHLSRNNSIPLHGHDLNGGCGILPLPSEQSQGHGQEPLPGHKLTFSEWLPTALTVLFHQQSKVYDVPLLHLQSLLYHDEIVSIKPSRVADYYDMFVPEYHNYLAGGMVHHNTGGGKTAMGYWWLADRMERQPGYGWGVCEPTYQMLAKIILNSPDPERPNLIDWLKRVKLYVDFQAVDRIIVTKHGFIYLGSADHPDSMQGPALKGYWLDEGGMMSLTAYQTALQRVSFYDGQILITTTPYNRGWLKSEIYDKADDNLIHVESWRSIDNPAFPKHVYYEMRDGTNSMQRHRFSMMYDAMFERPTGMIYSSFDSEKCVIEPFRIPGTWPRYIGQDYGPVHTAVLWYAKNPARYKGWPAGTYFCYREYLEGNKSIEQHSKDLKQKSKGEPIAMKVASPLPSERQWRREFSEKGWHLQECKITDVEVGIDRVWGMHKQNKLVYFNTVKHTLAQKEDYRRKLDENQQPTEVIDEKAKYHFMDSERYLMAHLTGRRPIFEV